MKKIYILALIVVYSATTVSAQCTGGRFYNKIFQSIKIDSAVYSTPFNLKMDVYQPTGDTMQHRPLIILAHEGAFVQGTRKDDNTITQLCTDFAQRGYVTVSIDYRLGTINQMLDSVSAIDVVTKALSDGKAAIRYFVKDAATTNLYKIDTNMIFVGGNSAGAVLYTHIGYLDSIQECPSYLQTAMNNNGGFNGNSGNSGYSYKLKGIINLAGGLNKTSFISPGNIPSANAQGALDNIVPYQCGYAFGVIPVNLCGLGAMESVYVANNITHQSLVFPGEGHVPWDTDITKYNKVDSLVKNFLIQIVCNYPAGIAKSAINNSYSISPNPATDFVAIQSAATIASISLYNSNGQLVQQQSAINKRDYTINTASLQPGFYFIKLQQEGNTLPVVSKLIINR